MSPHLTSAVGRGGRPHPKSSRHPPARPAGHVAAQLPLRQHRGGRPRPPTSPQAQPPQTGPSRAGPGRASQGPSGRPRFLRGSRSSRPAPPGSRSAACGLRGPPGSAAGLQPPARSRFSRQPGSAGPVGAGRRGRGGAGGVPLPRGLLATGGPALCRAPSRPGRPREGPGARGPGGRCPGPVPSVGPGRRWARGRGRGERAGPGGAGQSWSVGP